MKEFNNKVKEITDMILNKTLESNEVSNMEVNLTPVYDETRQAEIVFGLDNRIVRIEISGAKEIFGTVTVEIENYSYGFSLEELEQTKGPFGLHIERDIHFKEQPFGQIKELQ